MSGNEGEDENYTHNWNAREEKSPVVMYLLIALLCLALGWLLGSTAG